MMQRLVLFTLQARVSRFALITAMAVVWYCVPSFAASDMSPNGTLQCGSGPTYYPRGDWWATALSGKDSVVHYVLQANGLHATGTNPPENGVIQEAFDTWNQITCPPNTANGQAPRVQLTRDLPDYANRDSGDSTTTDSDGNVYLTLVTIKNVVYFVISSSQWTADNSILAYTVNLSSTDTGRTVTSDMQINAVNFTWSDSLNELPGCVGPASGAPCYDLYSTVLHEAGHFLGLDHVSCSDAVMYPYSTPKKVWPGLSNHEATGMCAMYPPVSTTTTFGQICSSNADCSGGTKCFVGTEFGTLSGWGVCSSSCTTDANCPTAFVCYSGKAGQLCVPGLHNTGSTTVEKTVTQCTSCTSSADCTSGMCVTDTDGTQGVCAQNCTSQSNCSTGFTCTATDTGPSVCYPDDPSSCTAADAGVPLNDQCYDETGGAFGQTSATGVDCGTSLLCVMFKPDSCSPKQGACVYYCDPDANLYSGQRCPDPNQICCFGTNTDGSCATKPSATNQQGGCFTIRKVGESCNLGENSICEPGAQCLYGNDNAGGSLCYQTCDYSTKLGCEQGATCVTGQYTCGSAYFGMCCDSQVWLTTNVCQPRGVNAKRNVGVECSQSTDCGSGTCYNLDGKSACSRRCNTTTGAGCPGNIDVNGDAKADGGFYCSVNSADEGWCWPKNGPAAYLGSTSSNAHGGGCSSTMADTRVLAGLAAALALLRRRPRLRC